MQTPDGTSNDSTRDSPVTVFVMLGGALSAIDPWTRVDSGWMQDGAAATDDAVGYRGMTMPFRVAGLTLGDADAAPSCPPFVIEIWSDRVSAQVFWHRGDASSSRIGDTDAAVLLHWASGSLTKDLRVVRFGDGDPGLEADLHLSASVTQDAIREFVTAFSWDVAALHAYDMDGILLTTEAWVQRAALSISRSTPRIPLRDHPSPEWHAFESPRGVFCSLQQSGGLCESDNVLYSVRRDAASLVPMATMPGHRNEWGCTRLIDVWLARDAVACFGRSLACEGFVASADGVWHAVPTAPITAMASWGTSGFLLGLHNGKVLPVTGADRTGKRVRLAKVVGHFLQLATIDDRAIGLIGATLFSARIVDTNEAEARISDAWSVDLRGNMSFDVVSGLDVDTYSSITTLAVLGDDGIGIVDARTGVMRSHFTIELPRLARFVGPGWLLVLDTFERNGETLTRHRVLDVVSGRWTEPVVTAEVSRLAVRGDEIQVGYANQSIAVWDRGEVCRGIGAWSFRSPVPESIGRGNNAPAPVDVPIDIPATDGRTAL